MDSDSKLLQIRKIIINADDLGLSEGTNNGIVNALQHGLVSSTSLMACGRAFDHAVVLLKKAGITGAGVHLTLDEERPVCEASAISSITTSSGRFMERGILLKKLLLTNQINMDHVYLEFRSQIHKIRDAGLTVTHLDGHGHVHVYPGISRIVSRLASEFGIRKIRFPAERYSYLDFKRFNAKKYLNKAIVTTFAILARKQFAAQHSVMPDGFMGMLFGGSLNVDNLERVFANMPNARCVEIMSHPGDMDEQREKEYGHWRYHWTDELNALLSNSKDDIRRRYGYEIISYGELNDSLAEHNN